MSFFRRKKKEKFSKPKPHRRHHHSQRESRHKHSSKLPKIEEEEDKKNLDDYDSSEEKSNINKEENNNNKLISATDSFLKMSEQKVTAIEKELAVLKVSYLVYRVQKELQDPQERWGEFLKFKEQNKNNALVLEVLEQDATYKMVKREVLDKKTELETELKHCDDMITTADRTIIDMSKQKKQYQDRKKIVEEKLKVYL